MPIHRRRRWLTVGLDGTDARPGLTPDEDQELRRLHWFEVQGMELADDRRRLKASIRGRDRRSSVRVPRQVERVFDPAPAETADASDSAVETPAEPA
jgi:hypothetical protein